MVPTFYDSIEIKKDSAIAKLHLRAARFGMVPAVLSIVVEAILFLLLVRFVFRAILWVVFRNRNKKPPAPPVEEERKIA